MLVKKSPSDHVVRSSVAGLATAAGITLEQCREALDVFMSPDPDSTHQENEGRKIRRVEDGWLVLNGSKYQAMMGREYQREKWRQQKHEQRSRKKGKSLTAREMVNRAVNSDPITLKDKAAMAAKWGSESAEKEARES